MKRISFYFIVAIFLLVLVSPLYLYGQSRETGIIQGKVLDEEGNPLPGVSITLSSPSLMGTRSTVSDSEGRFRFPALPSGVYTIEASLQGFNPVKKTDIRLHVGMTVTVDISMTIAKLEQEITVVGTAPVVDVKDSSLSKAILTTDLLEFIPVARDASQIINLAPGVYNRSAYGGGNATSNSFQLDGVELVDSWLGSGIYTTPIDFHVIEETQVVALGAPAEYGNFTGALVNIITKSGGNNFSGDLLFSYQGMNWKSENINAKDPKWSLLPESPDIREIDTSFHLGGPILKDKLWFYTGFEFLSTRTVMKSIDKDSPLKYPKVFLKLTFQPTERSRIQAFFEHHNRISERIGLSPLIYNDAQWDLRYPVYIGNLTFLHTFSPNTILEMKFAGYTMSWHSIPTSRDKQTPGHIDLATGERYGNSYWWSLWKSRRLQATASISHYVDNVLGLSHDLKAGLEVERSAGGGDVALNGGFVYLDLNHKPYMAQKYTMNEWAINYRYTLYIQDSWSVVESLVFNPGFRFDVYRGQVPGLGTVYKPTALEPRFGLTWDIFKDHKTVFKAHVGRYNENTKTYYISRAKQAMSDTIYYSVPEWGTLIELYRIPAVNQYFVDSNIRHPYMDQLTFGIERVLGKDFSLSAAVMMKDWNAIIEAINYTGIFEPKTFVDPETGKTYTVYNQLNPGADRYMITTPEAGKDVGQAYKNIVMETPDRKYRALEVSLTKRMSNNWQMVASYVYSKEEGSYPNSHAWGLSFNMGRSTVYFDPNYQINLRGRSMLNIPHLFKLQGTVILPFNFVLSGYYLYASGTTWTRRILVTGLKQGSRYILTEPAGSRRLPPTSNLDLRVEKMFDIRNIKARFMFDVFNVFNRGVETAVQDIYGVNIGKPTSVCSPRTFRAGIRVMF